MPNPREGSRAPKPVTSARQTPEMRTLMSPRRTSSALCLDSVAIHEAGEDLAPRSEISALNHSGFFDYTSLNVNGEMLRIDSSTSSGRNAGGAARCGQAGRSQRRQLIPMGVASSALKSSRLA
jgi:hypothetical protein